VSLGLDIDAAARDVFAALPRRGDASQLAISEQAVRDSASASLGRESQWAAAGSGSAPVQHDFPVIVPLNNEPKMVADILRRGRSNSEPKSSTTLVSR
jgi:hypothetical protein